MIIATFLTPLIGTGKVSIKIPPPFNIFHQIIEHTFCRFSKGVGGRTHFIGQAELGPWLARDISRRVPGSPPERAGQKSTWMGC